MVAEYKTLPRYFAPASELSAKISLFCENDRTGFNM
jgi:hypothetical protein